MNCRNKSFYNRLLLAVALISGLLLPAGAQSPAAGDTHYHHERYAAARRAYTQALATGDAAVRLHALTGLARLELAESHPEAAAQWISEGEGMLTAVRDRQTRCRFQLATGTFLAASSAFEDALDRYRQVYERCGPATLPAAGALLHTAAAYEKMGSPDSSLHYAERAEGLFQQLLDSTDVRFAAVYKQLGNAYFRTSRFQDAADAYRRAITRAERTIGPASALASGCLNNLANVARMQQAYDEAIGYSRRALAIKRQRRDTMGMASDYYSLGIFHYFSGDYGRARDYLSACLAIREQRLPPDHYLLSDPYEVLGILHEEAGDPQRTIDYFQQARRLKAANFGPRSVPVGYTLENIALLYHRLGRPDSALHYAEAADALLTAGLPPEHYALATHYYTLSDIRLANGQWNEAEAALDRSDRIFQALGLQDSPEYVLNRSGRARLLAQQGRWQEAQPYFDQARQRLRTPQLSTPYRPLPVTLTLLDQYLDYLFQYYQSTNEPALLTQLRATADDFLRVARHFRRQFVDPYTRSAIARRNAQVYRRLTGIFARLHLATGEADYLEQVYRFAGYGRAAALRDQLDERIRRYGGIPDSLLQRERTLKTEIAALHQELLETPDSNALRTRLLETEASFDTHVEQLTERYPRYYDLRYRSSLPPLEEVQAQLAGEGQIVQYLVDDKGYYALLIRPEGARLFPLGARAAVDTLVARYRQALRTIDGPAFRTASRALHDRLWAPLAPALSGERVVVLPAGTLYYVNHDNLLTGDGTYLIADHQFAYAFSLHDLLADTATPTAGLHLSIAPGFEDALKEAYLARLDSLALPDAAYLRTVRQPWCLRLSTALRDRFGFQPLTGQEAAEPRIKSALPEGRILNFATHALADPLDPLRSKIFLAKPAADTLDDGYLHTFELYGLQLKAALAVLGACESGIGELRDGEGMISLAYGMRYAGTPNTVMTLWKVDEKTNAALIEAFFERLAGGATIAEALRSAKLAYLEGAEGPLAHPFYWSGLTFTGCDGAVPLQRASAKWWWLAGGLLLVAAAGLGARAARPAKKHNQPH